MVEGGQERITGSKSFGNQEGMGPSTQMHRQAADRSSERRREVHTDTGQGRGRRLRFPRDKKQGGELADRDYVPTSTGAQQPHRAPALAGTQPLRASVSSFMKVRIQQSKL